MNPEVNVGAELKTEVTRIQPKLGELIAHDDPLSILGLQHQTDKARDHWYTPHYHRRFAELRDKPITLLEIGIGGYNDPAEGGNSLRMWRDYFSQATIIGVDIAQKNPIEGCEIIHGDATDIRVLKDIVDTYGELDIVIDDGSHVSDDILKSWVWLWDHVTMGGWYVIEDLGTAYMAQYGGSSIRTGDTTIGFLQGLIDRLHWQFFEIPAYEANRFDLTITGIEIEKNIAFLHKGDNS